MEKTAGTARAQTPGQALKAGDRAPDFLLKTDEGKEVSLNDFGGKRVLLYFFPKANTPG